MLTLGFSKHFILLVFLSLLIGGPLFAEDSKQAPETIDLANLAIPKSLGKIEERYVGTSGRWVIHIQDVHAHFTAQENIAAILDHLNTVYGIKKVALEGGWGETSFPETWALPNSRQKQLLVRALLEEDYITGPAYAAIFSPIPMPLVGIEDPALYEKNRSDYLKFLNNRESVLTTIKAAEDAIESEKKSVFNAELLNFDRKIIDFREGKKIDAFLPKLISEAQTKGSSLSDLSQLTLFKQALILENNLNKEKLKSESERLMKLFPRSKLHLEELLKSGKIDSEKIKFYPEAEKYSELLKLQDKLSHKQFFLEIETAIIRLKEKLTLSEDEKNLDGKAARFATAKKIITFQATPDDLTKYDLEKDKIHDDMLASELEDALRLALDFYTVAKQRDEIFYNKITNDARLGENIAVVTGGFHTEGLSQQLQAAGVSYFVISPDLNQELPNEELYFKRLQTSIQSQTLSENNNANFRVDTYIPPAVNEFRQQPNVLEGMRLFIRAYGEGAPALEGYQATGYRADNPQQSLTMEEALDLSDEEFLETLKKGVQLTEKGKTKIGYVFASAADFQKTVSFPINNSSVENMKKRESSSNFLIYILLNPTDEVTDKMMGQNVIRIYSTPEVFLKSSRTVRRFEGMKNRVGVVAEKLGLKTNFLTVPPQEGAIPILAMILNGMLIPSNDPAIQAMYYHRAAELFIKYRAQIELISESA